MWGKLASDWADMIDDLQAKAQQTRLRIPIVYGAMPDMATEACSATIFPHHVASVLAGTCPGAAHRSRPHVQAVTITASCLLEVLWRPIRAVPAPHPHSVLS